MVSGMRGGKTGALRPVSHQKSQAISHVGVVARPQSIDIFFNKVAAYKISECYHAYKEKYPPCPRFFIVYNSKKAHEKIKRRPQMLVSYQGHACI